MGKHQKKLLSFFNHLINFSPISKTIENLLTFAKILKYGASF